MMRDKQLMKKRNRLYLFSFRKKCVSVLLAFCILPCAAGTVTEDFTVSFEKKVFLRRLRFRLMVTR